MEKVTIILARCCCFGLRPSGFGLLSAFGFRPSFGLRVSAFGLRAAMIPVKLTIDGRPRMSSRRSGGGMKAPAAPNPKAETRRPKEGRIPKSDYSSAKEIANVGSGFWRWADETSMAPSVLREDPVFPPPPENLGDHTVRFGGNIIRFAKKVPRNAVNNRLIDQLVGAGTSVGLRPSGFGLLSAFGFRPSDFAPL